MIDENKYTKDVSENQNEFDFSSELETTSPEVEKPVSTEGDSWREVFRDKKLVYSTIGIFVLILALAVGAYFVFFPKKEVLPAPNVSLSINKPNKVSANQDFEINILYENKSDRPLQNVRAVIQFPESYTWKESSKDTSDSNGRTYDLEDVAVGGSGEIKITGYLEGKVGDIKSFDVTLQYKSSPSLITYKTTSTLDVEISSSDLLLSISGPTETISAQEVTYVVVYKNIGIKDLKNVVAEVKLPDRFTVLETIPPLLQENGWLIGDIAIGQEGSLRIRGVYDKSASGPSVIEIIANGNNSSLPLGRTSLITMIGDSPLFIVQSISDDGDDTSLPGETLKYTISVTNNGNVAVTNAIVSTELAGNAYNFASIKAPGGVFANNIITWTPGGISDLKLLEPTNTATVTFTVAISDPPTKTGERNMTVLSSPSVTTFEYKEAIKGVEVLRKIKTEVDLKQQISHVSGPVPLRVGQETVYKIVWTITNTTNTATNVSVTADLPLGQQSVESSQATGGTTLRLLPYGVAWDIGTFEANTTKTATLTISYTPTSIEVNTTPVFLSDINLDGTDMFVNQKIYDDTPVLEAKPQDRVEQ